MTGEELQRLSDLAHRLQWAERSLALLESGQALPNFQKLGLPYADRLEVEIAPFLVARLREVVAQYRSELNEHGIVVAPNEPSSGGARQTLRDACRDDGLHLAPETASAVVG